MIKRIAVFGLFVFLFFHLQLIAAYGDDATVLPKGVFSVRMDSKFYLPADQRFGPGGDTEDLAVDFNTRLNGSIFPQLSSLEQAFGMPSGSASLGDSVVSIEFDNVILDFYLFYGLTDRLTIGAKFPYWIFKSNVDTRVDSTNATLVNNPFLATPGDPFQGSPFVPRLLIPPNAQQPVTTDDVQNLLVSQFGYRRVESWSNNGFSDIEFGGRYQYYASDNWRLAFLGALRAPSGRTDDPDNLTDYAFGKGSWAILFHFNNDFIRWKNIEVNGTFAYDHYLSHDEIRRIPNDVDQPITNNKEKVDIKPGDVLMLEFGGKYNFKEYWTFSLFYRYDQEFKWDIDGNLGFAYDQAEAETDHKAHEYRVGLTYSTIPLFRAKKFALPLTAKLHYRNRFAGENVLKTQYIGLDIRFFF